MQIRIARSITLGAAAAAVAVVAACGSDVEIAGVVDTVHVVDTVRTVDTVHAVDTVYIADSAQRVSSYIVTFHEDSTQEYGGCDDVLTYCRVTVPADTNIRGSLTQSGDSLVATLGTTPFDALPMTRVHVDSLPIRFGIYGQCPSLTLYLTGSAKALRGTWVFQVDCHGKTSSGTLTGTLQ